MIKTENIYREKAYIDVYDLKVDLAYRIVELFNTFSFLNKALIEQDEEEISHYGKIFFAQFRTLLYAVSPFFKSNELKEFFDLIEKEKSGVPNPDIKNLIKKFPMFLRKLKEKGIYDLTIKTIDPSKAYLE